MMSREGRAMHNWFMLLTLGAVMAVVAAPATAGLSAKALAAEEAAPSARYGGSSTAPAAEPLRLHPENPHYFLWRGQPTVLVTSGEHYGAVLNLDFDGPRYLEAIQAAGLNLTRTFSGVYREIPSSFKIKNNPLAPAPNRYISPWARSTEPGYFDGGAKFDLSKWDPAYFARLKGFLAEASRRGIVVELVLFCPMYKDELWKACPMYAGNNVNGIGDLAKDDVHTLKNGGLLEYQLAVTRKIVTEVNEFDNLYFEIANEPYFGGITLEWQQRIGEAIVETEKGLPRRHLIAQNIANGSKKIGEPPAGRSPAAGEGPFPLVSIFNFHYCSPPNAVAMNRDLNRVIADDETGFKGSADQPYAADGWDFLLAGGAAYSNLDYSFYPGHEDGSGTPDAPGGGSPALRKSLAAAKAFIEHLDFIRMAPDAAAITTAAPKVTVRTLAEKGKQYAAFIRAAAGPVTVTADLPAGKWAAEWVDIHTGASAKAEPFDHAGGARSLVSPDFKDGIALRIVPKI